MKVFIDTEFTHFVDRFCELISFALVDETGRELYVEIDDWNQSNASDFVLDVVKPLLGRFPEARCTKAEAKRRLERYLCSHYEPVVLVIDSRRDLRLLCELYSGPLPHVRSTLLLTDPKLAACQFWIDTYFESHRAVPRHHALEDARALRQAYQATTLDLDGEVTFEGTSV